MIEQQRTRRRPATLSLDNPRPRASSLYLPALPPRPATIPPSVAATVGQDMSYNRTLSPGGRRIHHPGRASDSFAPGSYYSGGASGHRTAYGISPRTSNTGVIPLSSETFVNVPPPSGTYNSRPSERHDTYSGRPRRSSLVDQQRGSAPSVTQMPNRSRPTVVQNDSGRPSSPMKGSRDKDYYVTPASSKEPSRQVEHKKLYSVDDGKAKLVADVDLPAEKEKERHHRRRESTDRSGYKSSSLTADGDRHRDRSRRTYYPNSGHNGRGRDGKSIEDDDAFSYTDPAGMYRDTEPRWREQRPRRGSVDRGGASRERPVSMLDVNAYGADPRLSAKNISNGPPVSTRGWDKIGDGVGRTQSVRDAPPRVAQSPNRGRFLDPRDPYYVPPRTASRDGRPEGRPRANSRDNRSLAIHHNGPAPVDRYADSYASESDFLREPRRERRPSHSRRNDASVERRGFGIRADSKDRHGHNKGSNESFEKPRREYRDSGYAEPHRRETAPPEMASGYQQYERERRREDDMAYGRDYSERPRDREQRERDRDWVETDRERERERMMERSNRDTRDRDRGDSDREKHHSRRSSGLGAATGGLAGAAAAFGLGKVFGREKSDERDSDKERDSDRERERERQRREDRDREREKEREREKQAEREREKEKDREREKEREREAERQRYEDNLRREERDRRPRGPDSYSDEAYGSQRDRDRDAHREGDRSLGFAFEKPAEPSRPPQPERPRERDFERDNDRAAEMPKPAMDPDEDYRRRMEQVQKELGRGPPPADERSEVSDPDRERRRREREARLREREELREPKLDAGIGPTTYGEQSAPPPGMRRDYENESVNSGPSAAGSADTQGLRRKPSVLDRPMDYDEPAAQIIDNRLSDKRENRVRIVDPPTEEEDRKPKGILKKPTEKFPDYPDAVREGVAPLKDASKDGIPPGARWTKIDRRLVNPEALEEAKERFEERIDCVIVLRVLTKEEIQKLADKTREIRDKRYDEEERSERKTQRRRERNKDRKDRDEFSDDSEDEFKEKPVRMLEAPSTGGASSEADFIRENRDRRRERDERGEAQYNMSGGLGRREDEQGRY